MAKDVKSKQLILSNTQGSEWITIDNPGSQVEMLKCLYPVTVRWCVNHEIILNGHTVLIHFVASILEMVKGIGMLSDEFSSKYGIIFTS